MPANSLPRDGPVVCLVTVPPDRALTIASALVEHEFAACVNIVAAVQSVHCWNGTALADEESLLVIKTTGVTERP